MRSWALETRHAQISDDKAALERDNCELLRKSSKLIAEHNDSEESKNYAFRKFCRLIAQSKECVSFLILVFHAIRCTNYNNRSFFFDDVFSYCWSAQLVANNVRRFPTARKKRRKQMNKKYEQQEETMHGGKTFASFVILALSICFTCAFVDVDDGIAECETMLFFFNKFTMVAFVTLCWMRPSVDKATTIGLMVCICRRTHPHLDLRQQPWPRWREAGV